MEYLATLIHGSAADRTVYLNDKSKDGWSLVTVDAGMVYFQRQIPILAAPEPATQQTTEQVAPTAISEPAAPPKAVPAAPVAPPDRFRNKNRR